MKKYFLSLLLVFSFLHNFLSYAAEGQEPKKRSFFGRFRSASAPLPSNNDQRIEQYKLLIEQSPKIVDVLKIFIQFYQRASDLEFSLDHLKSINLVFAYKLVELVLQERKEKAFNAGEVIRKEIQKVLNELLFVEKKKLIKNQEYAIAIGLLFEQQVSNEMVRIFFNYGVRSPTLFSLPFFGGNFSGASASDLVVDSPVAITGSAASASAHNSTSSSVTNSVSPADSGLSPADLQALSQEPLSFSTHRSQSVPLAGVDQRGQSPTPVSVRSFFRKPLASTSRLDRVGEDSAEEDIEEMSFSPTADSDDIFTVQEQRRKRKNQAAAADSSGRGFDVSPPTLLTVPSFEPRVRKKSPVAASRSSKVSPFLPADTVAVSISPLSLGNSRIPTRQRIVVKPAPQKPKANNDRHNDDDDDDDE